MSFRRILAILAPGVLTMAGGSVVIFPNTLFLDEFKDATQSYKNGFPVPVSAHVHNLVTDVKSELLNAAPTALPYDLTVEQLTCIKPYTVFGFDMYRFGWIKMEEFGARLGIPQYFEHTKGDIKTSGIVIANKPVTWSTPEAQQMKQSLMISDQAKKFAIAREILMLMQNEPEKKIANNIASLVTPLLLIRVMDHRLKLKSRPIMVRLVIYGGVVTFFATFWLSVKDAITRTMEKTVDANLSAFSTSYAKGGLEFYENIAKRNISLRALLGDDGTSLYSSLGNEQSLIRTKHIPVVERVAFFNKVVAQNEEAQTGGESEELEL